MINILHYLPKTKKSINFTIIVNHQKTKELGKTVLFRYVLHFLHQSVKESRKKHIIACHKHVTQKMHTS